MQPFVTLTGVAVPLDTANLDTDQIIPARFMLKPRGSPGYANFAFYDIRYDDHGKENPDFKLNQAVYRGAKIIVADVNFGCGSAREAAVYVLYDYGIRAVIAPSFGEIHYANELQNGMLPVTLADEICRNLRDQLNQKPGSEITIDLERQMVTAPNGSTHPFDIDPRHKELLIKGSSDSAMQNIKEIEEFEKHHYKTMPWLV